MSREIKRSGAMLLAGALIGSLLTVMPTVATPPSAEATYATGGSGQYRDNIDWMTWDVPIFTTIEDGQAMFSERMIGGQLLRTECVLTYHSGEALAYKPGNWKGDSLDDLYNVGGTDRDNELVNAIITGPENAGTLDIQANFDIHCSATLNDVPVELGGLVVADAEETTNEPRNYEWVEITPIDGEATWRLLEQSYSGCPSNSGFRFTNNDGTIRFDVDGPSCRSDEYWPGNNYVAYLDGATAMNVTTNSAAAVAFGVVLNLDTGDAPESYGQPWSVFTQPWTGGEIPEGVTFATELPLATMSNEVTPRLGEVVTADTSPLHSDNANADEGDDSADLEDPISVKRGEEFSTEVDCTGPGYVAGWIDWNGNGTFDDNESSDVQECVDGNVTLTWTVPDDATSLTSFARLRIDTNESALTPIGFGSGEIEDYQVNIMVAEPALEIEKTSSQTENSRVGDEITYTVTATNIGEDDFTEENPAVILDDLSEVLDDATYNADVATDQAGEVSYEEPLLSWIGALPVGETVELTYSVTLTAGGDGNVRNVAFASDCDPADEDCGFDTPVCEADNPACDEDEFVLPRLTIEKSADRTDLPAVGESVEYTVTITNEGPGVYTEDAPATFTDDLSDVIDAATFDGNTSASTGEVSYDEPTLSWEGALEAGESATVTYSVIYTGEGDQNLLNLACVPENEVLPGAEPCDFNRIPGADLEQWKQVESSDTPAVAGSVLTYTLFFKSDGETAASVDAIDDLTHVLDDADVTVEPTSADGLTATRDNERITITGSVPSGETYTVTYQVTVKDEEDRGDNIATNFLMENDPDDPPVTPPTPDCVPTEEQLPDCTSTKLPVISYSKSVEASETPVVEGTVLTYTVTVKNTGEETGNVSREDVLTDVLDDAELTRAPESDTDSVTVSEVQGERFEIDGELAAGETATITYEVTVLADEERGDNTATNFLVTPGDDPGECVEGDPECTTTNMPEIESSKSVDPESGSTVVAGQEVTYTLSFTNIGTALGDVDYIDHLSGVFDDAELTAGPTTSNDAVTAELEGDENLAVSGELEAGETVTVSYTVAVLPDGQRGDNELGNVLAPTGSKPVCGDDGVSCTNNPIPELEAWKTVDPASGATLAPGAEATYTLHFENTGKAPVDVAKDDVLTQVLDDADVTTQPSVSSNSLTASEIVDGRFAVTGSLDAGEKVTVTYVVAVKPDGERGDDRLGNFLVETGEDPPEGPCVPVVPERPDCTINHVSNVEVAKSSDPESGTELGDGDRVTYTLTFTNTSTNPDAAPSTIDYTDHMADVLDDATLVEGPTTSSENLAADVDDDTIRIAGDVPSGEVYTVTYTVKVNDYADQGDHHLGNVVAITGEEPVCAPDSPLCTSHNTVDEPGLAFTGSTMAWTAAAAALSLILAGGALLLANRRRQSASIE